MKKTIFISAIILLALTQCKKEASSSDLTQTIVGTYYNSSLNYYIQVGKKDDKTVTLYLHGDSIANHYFDSVTMNTTTAFTLNNGDTSYWQQDTTPVYTTHTGNGYFNASDIVINIVSKTYSDSTHALISSDSTTYAGLMVIVQ